jgi:hypothetical protein
VAKATGRDINEVAADMVASGCARALETVAIQRALARAVSGSMVYDGTAGNINPDAIVETLKLFGEELDDSQLAVWAMNAKPYWDAAKISDSTGRALYTDVVGGRLRELGGAPVRMTAKSDLVVAGSPTTYKNAAREARRHPRLDQPEREDRLRARPAGRRRHHHRQHVRRRARVRHDARWHQARRRGAQDPMSIVFARRRAQAARAQAEAAQASPPAESDARVQAAAPEAPAVATAQPPARPRR